jgi:hypothetical protein
VGAVEAGQGLGKVSLRREGGCHRICRIGTQRSIGRAAREAGVRFTQRSSLGLMGAF